MTHKPFTLVLSLLLALLTLVPTASHAATPQIAAGYSHALALKSDGTVWAWGSNVFGQLGNNSTSQRLTPVQVSGLNGVVAIATGTYHSVAVKQDGTVWSWGLNDSGQLGDNGTTDRLTPGQVSGLTGVVAITAGSAHTIALKSDGTVWAWGNGSYGQLGNGVGASSYIPIQVKDSTGTSWLNEIKAIAAGWGHTLVLKQDGTVWGFGYNYEGELGNGTSGSSSTQNTLPIQVKDSSGTGELTDILAIAAGYHHAAALRGDGTAWTWGANSSGELGDGTITQSTIPVQVKDQDGFGHLINVSGITAGNGHCIALKSDGTVYGWGNNGSGQLGDNSTTNRLTPVQVNSLVNVTAISAGGFHTLALKNDGTVWAWGSNANGQLGDNSMTNRLTPVAVTITALPFAQADPASLNFGDLATYSTSSPQTVTISNSGTASLLVSAINLTGANPGQFGVTPGSCASLAPTIAPGSSCTVSVTFTPTTLGPKGAALRITFNGDDNPLDVPLTGIGFIPYFTLTVTAQGTGSGRVDYSFGGSCTGSCSQSFASNTTVQLTPVADSGALFSGWSGCDSVTGNVCRVTMDAAKSVAASFAYQPAEGLHVWTASGLEGLYVYALAIDPATATTVYAGTGTGGVFKSTDGGIDWLPVNNGLSDLTVNSLAIHPASPATVYAGTASGVFRSTTGGDQWSPLNEGLTSTFVYVLTMDPTDPAIIYAGTANGGLFKSTDAGLNWQEINIGLTDLHVYTVAVDPETPSTVYCGTYAGVFKSTDAGTSWNAVNAGLSDLNAFTLALEPGSPATLYVGTNDGVFKSSDGALSWSAVNNGMAGSYVRTLAIDRTRPGIVYAGTGSGVFQTTDGGLNWSAMDSGPGTTGIYEIAIAPLQNTTLYAGSAGHGVFKIAPPALSIAQTTADFGPVATYASSTTQTFTISNTGSADLSVTATTLGGANSGEFSLQPDTCPSLTPTLLPGSSCTMNITFVPTTVGIKSATLQMVSNDPVNPQQTASLTGIAYDPPPMGLVLIDSGAGSTNNNAVTLTLAALDNSGTVAGMRFSNNNTSWSSWELYDTGKTWTITTLGGDGSKTVYVQFRDADGNVSGSFADSITLDTTPPVTTITAMPGPFYPAADGSFTFTASESASFQCRMDTGSWASCASPFSFNGLTDGLHTFSVKSVDPAGNVETTAKSYSFTIDTSPPETAITGQPAALSNAPGGMFAFSSPDASAVFHCKVDGGAWSMCFAQFGFSGLADGSHSFSVKAIDRSGNMDLTPATYTWTIDTTPPESTVFGSASGESATFAVGSPDPTATLLCKLDSSAWTACSGTFTITGLANGSHTFSVKATDPAGNTDPTPAIYSWTAPCNVRVVGGSCYTTINEALTAAPDGSTIQAKAMIFPETPDCVYPKTLTFSGGFGPNFESPTPGAMTTVSGFTMTDGSIALENLVIQ